MLVLPRPRSSAKEDKTLKTLALTTYWTPHLASWLKTYVRYRAWRGNPWMVQSAAFPALVQKAQRRLYSSRASGGPLARIREALDLPCCAMCGSHHNGTLDHFLPKQEYPEFSILPSNLVPACSLCNSGSKGGKIKGSTAQERFLHPYFDKLAVHPLWRARITGPFAAPTFTAVPLPHLGPAKKARVRFHLGGLISKPFETYCAAQWKRLPAVLLVETGPAPTLHALRRAIRNELKRSAIAFGVNAWRTALLRGIIANTAAVVDIHSRI